MPGKSGKCRVRTNRNGILYADTYNNLSATHFDPIEKKPLYHFYPGSEIFSLGSLGCNFRCNCCQNYEISQTGKAGFPRIQEMNVEKILRTARTNPANIGIAYTYNEPFVWYEYMFDIAKAAREEGMKNVMVSNGYVNPDPLNDLMPYIDAFNIDLKTFDARSYKEFTNGDLSWVLHTITRIVEAGKHLEITMLIVPGVNDSMAQFRALIDWYKQTPGKSVPLHLSRYFPHYRMNEPPTSLDLLLKMAKYAKEKLDFVYLGNAPSENFQNTHCPECGELVIQRQGYYISNSGIDGQGRCSACGEAIAICDK